MNAARDRMLLLVGGSSGSVQAWALIDATHSSLLFGFELVGKASGDGFGKTVAINTAGDRILVGTL